VLEADNTVKNDPAAWSYYRKQGTQSRHLEDQSRATPEVQALTVVLTAQSGALPRRWLQRRKRAGQTWQSHTRTRHSTQQWWSRPLALPRRIAGASYNERCLERGTESWEEFEHATSRDPSRDKLGRGKRQRRCDHYDCFAAWEVKHSMQCVGVLWPGSDPSGNCYDYGRSASAAGRPTVASVNERIRA
jgi:hypothetical protein